MKRIISSELVSYQDQQVRVEGWLHILRALGKLNFLILRDRSGLIQVVIHDKAVLDQVKDLQVGSILDITGIVKVADQAELGVEITEPQIKVVSAVTEAMPVEINKEILKAHIDTILDYRPLSLRHASSQAIFRIQATLVAAYREFLTQNGFTEFFGPNIISASSEGGSEMFKVQYFDHEALLSQSAQLYKQMMVGVYERVFALMKCFRAEKSNTRRHLTEATQFEFEMGFIEDYSEVMDMLELVVKFMIAQVQEKNAKDLKILGLELAKAPQEVAFPRITFKDALQLVFERTGTDERNELDLSPLAEKELCKYAREQFGTDFIFVTNFLRKKTAFYAHPNEQDPEVTNYFDLLCREIEIASGGQRIHEHDALVESLKLKGLDPANFSDYLSIFKFGMPPHGGFGMGMERFTMMALGLENIRMSTLFPSDPRRIASVPLKAKVYSGTELRDEIISRLTAAGMQFQKFEHEATLTSDQSSQIRGTELKEGVKAMILRNKKTSENIMVCIPADQRLDFKLLEQLSGHKYELEDKELIKTKFGLEIGGIPPFGNLLGLKTFFSKAIADNNRAAFNCGTVTDSIVMGSADLIKIIEPELF
jgi:nondiscriminating aspartyl-tRNA synthetase